MNKASGDSFNLSFSHPEISSSGHDAGHAIIVPDAHLLFSGDFARAGRDLIISDDHHRFTVPNYFAGTKHPTLVSPEGAPLDPRVIEAYTGHTAYAQAGDPASSAGKVVGHVVKMTGSASIVRNGVSIVVNNGDVVYQNDLVQTGSNSTLGLVLEDGGAFNLSANSRFMLNELTYDPTSTSNSALLTLVQGAASFVAGQVAKTGDMKVATPVATMGIRGTAVILDISSTDGKVSISVVDQQDGQVHAVQVYNTAGVLIGTVTSNGNSLTLTPTATFEVIAQESNKTPAQVAQEFAAFQAAISTYDAAKQIFPNLPQHTENTGGDKSNNPSPNTQTKFAGSPPLNPPGTEYHPPTVQNAQSNGNVALPQIVVINNAPPSGGAPTSTPTSSDPPPTIQVKASAIPFVVTPPTLASITSGGGDHFGPVMSASGDVVYDPDGAIYFYDRETGTTLTVASPANGWIYGSPTISMDGRYIVYQGSQNGGSSSVFVYGTDPSDATHYHQQTLIAQGGAAAVSGDGNTIVVEQGAGNIAIYDLQGTLKGTITPTAVGGGVTLWRPAISADGHVITFWSSDSSAPGGSGHLYAYNSTTHALTEIASTASGAGTSAASVSADGHLIAYAVTDTSGHSEVYLYDLNTSHVVFHTANASGSSYYPVLSPDGHFLAFTSDAHVTSADTNAFADIYIVDVTNPSSPQYKLVSEGNASATNGGVAISAGGQYVAFGSASQIFLADPTSGKSAIILETASSPDILTAHGSITLTGDFTGVGMSITDAAGNPAPNFTATFDSSGHINWTFSEAKSDFSFLSYGEDATQQFVIKLSADNGTLTIPVFVTVHDGVQPTIPPTDAAPIANPVTLAQSDENTPHTITAATLLAGVTDIDGPFPLAITALSIASGGGSLVHNDDGSWTYTPAENYSGPVKFNYTASDGTLSASSTASLNISAVDQPPVAGAVTLAPGAEDTAYTINPSDLLAGVSDPDGPFPLSITALSIASGGGSLVHNDDGTWTYTPAANYNGPVSFNYTASDGTLVSSATASLDLAPVNDAPTIAGGSVVAGTVDVPVTTGSSGSHTAGADTILNAGSGLISGLNGHSGYGTLALPAGDDNSSNAIDITSVFGDAGINFFGHSYTSLYVNNNGNITFNGPNSTFTPSVINAGTGNPIIAPFWADVDTRGAGHVYYDLDTVDGVMTITWDHVGYYSGHTDRLNSFQVVLVNEGGGNFDIVYRYADIQWTTGDVSGGQAARAGYSAGDGTHYFELPASGNVSALLALPATEGNTHVNGVDEFDVRNGEVGPPSLTTNGTINFSDVDPNDTHSIQSVTYTGSGDALGTLHFTKVTDATGGATGQFTWTYTADTTTARAALDALPDHSKIETFDVVITDGDKTVTQTITVTLNETGDHAPVASAVALTAGTEDTAYTVHASDLLAGVTDSDGPSPLSISALSVAGGGGTLTDHHDGTWTYTPVTDYNGAVSFNYTATDGTLTASSTASLNLAAVDDAPVAIPVTLIAGTEDTAYTIHASALLAGVTDVDGPFPLSISALSVSSGGGTLLPHDDGTWTYTPAANYNGPVSFDYTASDGTLTSSSTASLTLAAADDAPSTSPVTLADGTEDNAYTIHAADLLAGVTDVDGPFPLSISALSVASGGGSLIAHDDGTWTYTPAANYNGPVTFDYTASDGTLTSSSTASLNLAAVNDAPQATAVTLASGTENASYTITSAALLAGVIDVDGPFPLSISALGVASGGGSLADNGDGTWTYTPANNFAGSVSFNYTASDGSLTSGSTASLTLAEVALQPVLAVGSSTTLSPTDGSAIKATFELHGGDVLTFDWDFAGHDYMPYNDFSFVTVNGQSHLLGLIQSVGNYGTTGWKTFSYLAPADGGYTIGIGQFNVIDQALNSHTFVDNVRINGTLQTSFEGALTPFASLGSVSITPELTDSNVHIVPTDGVDMVLLDSSYASVGSVESFLGLASGSIAKVATPSGLEHTPIVVPISITTAPGAHPDSTFATISGFPPGSIFNFGSFDDATNTWKVDAGDLGGGLTITTPEGFTGQFTLSVTATSVVLATGTSATTPAQTLSIGVDAPPDSAPVASPVTLADGTEDTAYTINASDLLAGVTDTDGPFPLTVTALTIASGGGSLVDNDDGTWTYTPAADHNGLVNFSYTASDGALTSSSTASLTLTAVNDLPTGSVTIDGTFRASEVLTANTSALADADGLGTFAYQWQRDGADIALQTGNTYTLTGSDVGHSIDVVVHYTDGQGTAESVTSAGTPAIAAAGIVAGNNDDNTLTGTNANDALQGFGGNDTIHGLDGVDRAIYTDATGGITVNLVLGTVTGPGVGSDTLVDIEAVQGSNFVDHYTAFDAPTDTNFAGTSNTPGVPTGFNSFEGMAGDDVITGNVNIQGQILTRISYLSATAGVNVDLATGVASGNASVGTDHFTNVNAIIGSNSADTLSGSNNPNGTYEQFEGRGGDDVIDGRGGYDFATYNNDPATTSGISVDLADGKVYGDASIGTDTLKGVEGVRGTNFDDTYDATNFSGGSTNAGSNGTFNNFDGVGGDDTIIGNGNTRIQYTQATDGVNVNFVLGIASGNSSVGTDHFSGVNAVMGSMFNDIFVGSNANENFMGLAGDDSIDGGGGFDTALYNNMTYTTGGITVDMAAGTVDDKIIGDHSSGHDTLRLIEAVQGTAFADSYDATHFGQAGYLDPAHFNVGNFGNYNQFEGLGGDDNILGNGNTRVVYQSATSGPGGSGVTIHMAAGTADGNASVGHDTFSAVNGAVGSNFNDAYDAAGFVGFNEFVGLGGSDQITGNNTTQINYSGATASVTINMLAGTVDGNASVGHDTFTGVSSVVGSNYNDVFNATGFIGPIQYVSFAGNDQITGNGETQLAYWGATSGVTADLATGTVDKGASGQDTFTGVRSIQGSNFADTLRGDAGDNGLFGSAGEDVLDGRGGTDYLFGGTDADTFVYGAGYGTDTIADFLQSDGDKIDLRTVPNVHAFADLNVSQSGLNTLIDFGSGNTLTLLNVDHTLLGDGDFLFTPPDAPPSITGDFSVLTVKGGGVTLRGLAAGTSTADLVAVDADNPPEQLVYTVTGTQHGHLAYSLTGPAITSFTQAEVNARAVFFVSDDTTYVGGAGFTVTLSDGTITTAPTMIGATIVDAQLSVQTAGGFDFDQDNPIAAMGLGTIADGASDKTFKIENLDANRDFTFTGTGFTYAGSGSDMHLTGGIITAIAETGHGTPPQPAFSRFDLYVPAVEWMNAVSAAAHGDQSVIETLTRSWTFNFNGNAGPDGFGASNLNDIFTGNGGDDTFEGDFGYDRAYYGNASAAVNVQLADGFVTGAATGTDTLKSIELVTGSDFADLYNAGSTPNNPGGFSAASTNSGSTVTSNTLGLFNEFEGRGGDDQIFGNGQTRVSYYHATSAVTVTFTGWTNAASGSTGFADGDASVGHDTLSGVNWARGSFFDDIFHGATNPSGSTENFEGLGGDDLIDGGGGFDRAVYIGAFDDTGINVQLAEGIVTGGPTTGIDTLLSVEAIRGTGFDDFYDASGFTTVATADNPNAGNASFITVSGTERAFNEFEGEAGNDTVTGNGNTRVAYYHATAGVVVTLGNNGSGTADGDASIGHDTFISGVRSITGGEFNDILTGNGGGNVLDGRGGNDILDGRASNDTLTGGTGSDIFVYAAGGGADRITDLNPGDGDRVDLRGVPGVYSLADVLALATTNGPDTVITFSPGNSITLANTAPANLVASEFIFAGPPGFVSEMSSEGGLGVRSEHISSAPVTFHMQLSAAASGVLTIVANDVENGASPEIDNVFINGHALGQLSQVADGADSTSIFTIDPSLLIEGDNLIQVANANTTPGWNFTVVSAQFQSATTGFSSLIVPDDVARQNSSTPAGNISVRSAWTASHQDTFTLALPNSGTLKNVALTLHANDVELPGASPSVGEVDQVFVNGHAVGFLTQAPDAQNSVTVLNVDSSFLVNGNNVVSVYNVNTDGPGTWNFQIDQLSFTGGVSTATFATPPSVAVTVQASDGYDFSTVSADLIASAISSSASTSDHIFLVDAAKGITFEIIGTGFTYDPDTHQPTGGTINEIDILDSADPTQTGQDHVLANSNGWGADAATLFSAINQAKSPVAETSNFGKAMLNSLLTSPIFSYVGSRGSDDHDGAPHDGADVFVSGKHADVFNGMGGAFGPGDPGSDTVSYAAATAGVTASLLNPAGNTGSAAGDVYISIENLRGTSLDDVLTGDGNNNTLEGGGGHNVLDGGSGGIDTASYEHAPTHVNVNLNSLDMQPVATGMFDQLLNIEGLRGSSYDDTLAGNGNSILEGGPGDDNLNGKSGGSDTASYEHAPSGVQVDLAISGPQDTGGAGSDKLSHIANLMGSQFNDILAGDANDNMLTGNGGNDTFVFREFSGGIGHDIIQDFITDTDHIQLDYAAFDSNSPASFTAWLHDHATQQGNGDLLIDLDVNGPDIDTILLRNTSINSLRANDFILPAGGGGVFA